MEKKAFEVSITTIQRISDFSSLALLERTYENRLGLDDTIKKIKNTNIDGLLDVSIYQRQKDNDNTISFKYLAGFGFDEESHINETLAKSLNNSTNDDVTYESYTVKLNNKSLDTYRFVKPIIYKYKNNSILLGATLLYYDRNAINKIVEQMIDLIFTITLIILLLATLVVYFAGVKFTNPILQITKAATDVSKGNLDVNLNINTNDEVQHLAEQFNIMVNGLKEKQKMQKFVSDSTIDMIQDGSACKLVLGGEYRKLTFLFSDIRGFTAMSETKDPSEIINIINFYLNLQSNIIKSNGGDIDKFIGDEVMASFAGEDATIRALKTALEIQKMLQEENLKREAKNETICKVGIGINEGSVIVGNIGSDERMDFTSIGSAVNLASRLCSSAKENEIIIEKKTFESSKSDYKIQKSDSIKVKGISAEHEIVYINH